MTSREFLKIIEGIGVVEGMTQQEMADKVKVNRTYLSRILNLDENVEISNKFVARFERAFPEYFKLFRGQVEGKEDFNVENLTAFNHILPEKLHDKFQEEVFGKPPLVGDYQSKYIHSMEERISEMKQQIGFLQRMMESNLNSLATNQQVVLAEIKGALKYNAHKESKGDQQKEIQILKEVSKYAGEFYMALAAKDKTAVDGM